MTINESLGDQVYDAYKGAGQTTGLILPAIILNLIAFPGVLLNSMIVVVTFKNKSLDGSFLVALICFYEALHQSGHLVFLVIAISGTNFIEYFNAVLLYFHAIFGLNAGLMAMCLAAMDRCLAVCFPIWHKMLIFRGYSVYYRLIFVNICSIYGLYWCGIFYHYAQIYAEMPSNGYISDMMLYDFSTHFFVHSAILNSVAIAFYSVIGIKSKMTGKAAHHSTSSSNAVSRRLIKSLLVILLINIGGYLITLSAMNIIDSFPDLDFMTAWDLLFALGCLLNLGVAFNAPVLYMTSTNYRNAIRAFLKRCFGLNLGVNSGTNSNVVHVLPVYTTNYTTK